MQESLPVSIHNLAAIFVSLPVGELGSQHACWTDHQIALVVAQLLAGHHGFATSGVTLPKVVLGNLAVHWTLQICFLPELRLENQELGWDEHGLHRQRILWGCWIICMSGGLAFEANLLI